MSYEQPPRGRLARLFEAADRRHVPLRTILAARSTRPSSRCPMTGPALRLLNPRAASMPDAMNA